MIPEIDDYDWGEAFDEVQNAIEPTLFNGAPTHGFTREEVMEVRHISDGQNSDGQNDGDDWIAVFILFDGRWVMLAAGCDYSGWGCRRWGSASVALDYDSIMRYGCSTEHRRRFNATIPELDGVSAQ